MSDSRKFFNLCYVDGKADGVVRCQFGGSRYVAYRFPRDRFDGLRKMKNKDNILEHLEYKGIYFLLTYSDIGKLIRVYVGKAGERADDRLGMLNRIYEHRTEVKCKGWHEAVLLTTDNNNWSATELNYLENGFFKRVTEALGADCCSNSATPTASRPNYEQQHELDGLMNIYAEECFSVMGVKLLAKREKTLRKKRSSRMDSMKKLPADLAVTSADEQLFHCATKKVKAYGCLTKKMSPKGFTVKAGSYISLSPVKSFLKEPAYATWKAFVDSDKVDETGRLKVDYEFSSPSLAASVVKAGNANGWTEWVNEAGEPLDVLRK